MARREQDREDLMAEARALVERASFRIQGCSEPVVIGFRRDGSVSFFISPEQVYQFNSAGELRRAFKGDLLYKADAGRLVSLRRERTADAVHLVRHDLTDQQTSAFLAEMHRHLQQVAAGLDGGRSEAIETVPKGTDLAPRIAQWLALHAAGIAIARGPRTK
jgi:hypothetical protein